jgi:hypothetical protein
MGTNNKRYDTRIIYQYMDSMLCNDGAHTQRIKYACNKRQPALYNCKICTNLSDQCRYKYQCSLCQQFFCICHFIDHLQLFKYLTENKYPLNCKSDYIELKQKTNIKDMLIPMFYRIAMNIANKRVTLEVNINNIDQKVRVLTQFLRGTSIQSLSKPVK